ncbi:MAG: RagB/SusD family nutrient uptake outer membrane protein [Tannerella sp.]|jgi:hypothetical protein|nr:RagB/SusD family nutrient uptake outer membrane protein [Tannerella sp.]
MKRYKALASFLVAGAALLLAASSCNIDPVFYSQVVPSTFYTNQDAVWQRFDRPFTHWRWYLASNNPRWELQELGTDEICLPTRGSDWYNGAVFQNFHHHHYTTDMEAINDGWKGFGMGVALAWSAWEDLQQVDLASLGFDESTLSSMEGQLKTLIASFYLDGLDFFGGVPLYNSTSDPVKGRSTALETFNYVDSILQANIANLPVKTELGAPETNIVHQAVAAGLLARLYFNAETYIGTPMYDKAAAICQDIIDGKYGKYALDPDWTDIFGFNNETSPEIMWTVPSQNAKAETDGEYWDQWMPYNIRNYLGGLQSTGGNNGYCLQPSLDPDGKPYTFKLSGPYRKFSDQDIRKQIYTYKGGGKYEGMFFAGRLVNPVDTSWYCVGAREYKGEILTLIDQVAYLAPDRVGTSDYKKSDIAHGEENSGIRLLKRSPRPTQADHSLMFNPDIPVMRLAEFYYTLAECKMRSGDFQGAADLINTVRKRYFPNGDPNAVTAASLQGTDGKYRMLDEWMQEFIGEARRRTDLIRWNAYVTESWWDHQATNDANLRHFPIHYSVMSANPLLEQNPGY